MALKGNLRDFSVTQLLNLINLARKTGTLSLESSGSAAWVSFRDGKLIYAQLGNEDASLTGVLAKTGTITTQQAQVIKTRAGDRPDKEIGILLINAGYLTQQAILVSPAYLDIICKLFTWGDGFFRFDADLLPPEDRITIRLDLEDIIIQGSRLLKESEQLQEEIPNLDMALDFVERPGANIRDVNLSVEEWRVVSYINPKNTIRQIARANKMSDLEIRRIVFGLLQAGLVDIVRPVGMPMPAGAKQLPPVDRKQQSSLVNRLIQRVRSL
jgi:hypothetical protein